MDAFKVWPEDDRADLRQESDAAIIGGTGRIVRNVTVPVLVPFLPAQAAPGSPAVIIAPGGAFLSLSVDSEGSALAELLNAHGVTAYVLEYSLLSTPTDDPDYVAYFAGLIMGDGNELRSLTDPHIFVAGNDAAAAVRLLRGTHGKIGFVGFSAGGTVAANVARSTHGDSRPDLVACIYAPFDAGTAPTAPVPPLFVCASTDDPFGVEGSMTLFRTWREAKAPTELHLFPRGGHGFGMNETGTAIDAWPQLFLAWLRAEGLFTISRGGTGGDI